MRTCDFLVIGGGVIGLSIARELKKQFNDARVILIEKEDACGRHASGRNSGVLHAGFYYSEDSLKARFTRDGNRLLTEYCAAHSIDINKCGKLVVARNEKEDKVLDELLRRAAHNGIDLSEVSLEEAREIEPRAITWRRALYSPTTASVDPVEVIEALERDAISEGVEIRYGVRYLKRVRKTIRTSNGDYDPGYVVNAAGLYADKVARDFGLSEHYRILPFKGLYLKSSEPAGSMRTNIYPVPDLKNPFLGVHFTVQVDGKTKIGPTAIPAVWREQYNGTSNFRLDEFLDIMYRTGGLFLTSGFDFKRLAFTELAKYSRHRMVSLASSLATDVNQTDYRTWARPGIRAQLINISNRKLEMDFVLESGESSMHILNAVSPAFTCSIPFSQYVCQKIRDTLQ